MHTCMLLWLHSYEDILHVLLKPHGKLSNPIHPSLVAKTCLALSTPTEVGSNYGQAYGKEQDNGRCNDIVPVCDASVILRHMLIYAWQGQ